MKYTIKTTGRICHYQFANIEDIQVNDIEYGEMDYFELEETLHYKNPDGSQGWIIKVKSKKK